MAGWVVERKKKDGTMRNIRYVDRRHAERRYHTISDKLHQGSVRLLDPDGKMVWEHYTLNQCSCPHCKG